MTSKEIFEQVRAHLQKQGRAAVGQLDGVCKYRIFGRDGPELKCAVGCLIPDDKYDPRMEALTAGELSTEYPEAFTFPPTAKQRELLVELQMIHDRQEPRHWAASLGRLEVKINNGEYDEQQ